MLRVWDQLMLHSEFQADMDCEVRLSENTDKLEKLCRHSYEIGVSRLRCYFEILRLSTLDFTGLLIFFSCRLLSVVCCDLDALLLLEAQYQVSNMLLHAQEENTFEISENHRFA